MTKEESIEKAKENIQKHPETIDTVLELIYRVGVVDGVKETTQFAIDLVAGKK